MLGHPRLQQILLQQSQLQNMFGLEHLNKMGQQSKTCQPPSPLPPNRLSTIGGKRDRVPIKDARGRLLPLPRSLRVCTMSADFWGLPTAGGTATAYGLLTSALSEDTSLDVRA